MSSPITLEQWIALNEEMSALARAGVPLERGLPELARDLPRKLRRVVDQVSDRLRAGETLDQILASGDLSFPPAYRAVIAAGVRSGNLASALESIATTARRAGELRQLTRMALAYPLAVLLLGYVLVYLALTWWMPIVSEAYAAESYVGADLLKTLTEVGQSWWWRIPWPPFAAAVVLFIWWKRSGRAGGADAGTWSRLPTYRQLLRSGRTATFAEVLALLVEHRVPLGESLRLAGEASGDRALRRGAVEMAERIERGESADADRPVRGVPPFIAWLIRAPSSATRLPKVLRQAAEGHRDRARRIGEWLASYLPLLLTALIGGGTAVLLAVVVIGPWYGMLYQMGQPK